MTELVFAAVFAATLLIGCGVRGKPLPPLTPPELGRGQPSFRRTSDELAFPQVAPVEAVPEDEASGASSGNPSEDKQ